MESGYKLTKNQKESIFLLQIGTFLEYFDLMLYVHMAVVLNELFFPPSDPKVASILAAFAFCSTYVLRPFGALIFGYIGDNYGRKPTVIITTTFMAIACLLMANLPTYAEIGITAAIMVSVLRMIQGITSMGEIVGARIYMTEIIKPPLQYYAVATIAIAYDLGSMVALGIASLAVKVGFNWRIAFWIGALVAVVGIVARTHLRETPEFADANRKMKRAIESSKEQGLENAALLLKSTNEVLKEKLSLKAFCYYFALSCGWPLCFYLSYIYFIPLLKESHGYSSEDVIIHNFYLSVCSLMCSIFWSFLSKKIYPLFISKFIGFTFLILLTIIPYLINTDPSNYVIFCIQIYLVGFGLSITPSESICIKHFPIFKRFTAISFGYALSRALMYIITSFGLILLTDQFGFYGIWILGIPLTLLWLKAIYYYESLEKQSGNYPLKGEWQVRPVSDESFS